MQEKTVDGEHGVGGKKAGGIGETEVDFNSSAFEALERDFQEVLSELVGDKSLERFRWEGFEVRCLCYARHGYCSPYWEKKVLPEITMYPDLADSTTMCFGFQRCPPNKQRISQAHLLAMSAFLVIDLANPTSLA